MALAVTRVRFRDTGLRLYVRTPTLELAAMSLSDASNRVLYKPLSSDEITKDVYVFSFPMPAGYRMYWPEHGALDGAWTPPAYTRV
jgi:hypothetical protein